MIPGCSSSALAGLLDMEAAQQVQTDRTEDHREAAKAFVEKRAPFLPAGEPAIDILRSVQIVRSAYSLMPCPQSQTDAIPAGRPHCRRRPQGLASRTGF